MKNNKWLTPTITTLLCLFPILAGIIFYGQLPEQMPVHFGFNNQPDIYGPKALVLFGIPLIMSVAQIGILALFAHATKNISKKPRLLSAITWFVPILTIVLYTVVLVYALGHGINVARFVLLPLGLFLCILGNYMPKSSYEQMKNYTHPTPKDEKSFRKTTKIAGFFLLALGLAFLVLAWIV